MYIWIVYIAGMVRNTECGENRIAHNTRLTVKRKKGARNHKERGQKYICDEGRAKPT
jgi:hypothetical protein